MKSTLFPVLFLVAAVLVSCGGGRSDAPGDGLVTIDVAADYPKEQIVLQDIADIEYIPLAISKDVLLKNSDDIFYISGRYIMVYGRGSIFVFNRDGSIRSHFTRAGRGPNEYMRLWDVVFDEGAEEFFVLDGFPPNPRLLVYSLDGTHKRTLPLPEKWLSKTLYSFDDKTLLLYDEAGLTDGSFSETPYHLISKTDGSITGTLAISMPRRYSEMSIMELTDPSGKTSRQPVLLSTGANKRFGGKDFTLADISSDTVYRYSRERVLSPVFVRTPSVHIAEPRTVWSPNLITENFTVFTITTLDFKSAMTDGTYPVRELMYNSRTGRVGVPDFINADTSEGWSAGTYETQAPANWAVVMLDPLRLKDAQEKGELKGTLAEIAAKIKEDDNPVVMIVRFK